MSEKEAKKSSLDLDFDDIAAPVKEDIKKSEPAPSWKPKKEVTPKDDEPVLLVPSDLVGQWYQKTISQCTPDEFDRWFKSVYPGVDSQPDDFITQVSRIRAFKHLLRESVQLKFKDKDHALTKN